MDTYKTNTDAGTFDQRKLKEADVAIVATITDAATKLLSALDSVYINTAESSRLLSTAKTHLETSVMFAVKAISRNY